MCCLMVFVFFKQKTAYEMRISDWSSDVCSSDLAVVGVDNSRSQNAQAEAIEGGDHRREQSIAVGCVDEHLQRRRPTLRQWSRQHQCRCRALLADGGGLPGDLIGAIAQEALVGKRGPHRVDLRIAQDRKSVV